METVYRHVNLSMNEIFFGEVYLLNYDKELFIEN